MSGRKDTGTRLIGRRTERGVLDELVSAVRAGQSRALVVHGEAGVGKTALLDYLASRVLDCRIVRAAGVESEMELAFAGLRQLCAPMLEYLDRLPVPQREALRTAFGISPGPAPDQFRIGLAVLTLLSDAAENKPLLCLIDDHQWLDTASAMIFAFVGRRLGAESVGMVISTRTAGVEVSGLPALEVSGLPTVDARALLQLVLPGPLDARVRDQIVTEARGNPLALVELQHGLTSAELAGGFLLPGATQLVGAVEESFRRRVSALPSETRRLLLLAAADPTGDPALVWRAAEERGIGAAAAADAFEAGLAEIGARVQFRHPLVRSAVYWSASPNERHSAHATLAAVTDSQLDPDRRVWHLAEAASAPDENIATELERSADHAQARGGLAAAAAFLEHSVRMTLDPARRAARALAAAYTKSQAGAFDAAASLLTQAESGPLDERQQARVDRLRAQLAFATSRGGEAPLLLVRAAKRAEPVDASLARETYLDAIAAAAFAGRLANAGGGVIEVAAAALGAPPPLVAPGAPDHLLDGLVANFLQGYAEGVPALREALTSFGVGMSDAAELRWMWLINEAALHLWDDEQWDSMSERYLELAREAGSLIELPLALSSRAIMQLFAGNLATASTLIDEQSTVTDATGSNLAPYAAMFLAAMRGRRAEATTLIDRTISEVQPRGEGIGIAVAEWTRAVLNNGLGNYSEALAAAEQALYHQQYPEVRYPGVANWAAAELIEAAVHAGESDTAAAATRWITEMTAASGTEWALGVEARSRALLAEGVAAERLYQEAISHFRNSRVRTDLARAHLVYGEWLRRERRRGDAREQLLTANQMLESMGMAAFADRARIELLATGETARLRAATSTSDQLTAQEAQIARLARDGLSNPEIGSRLFISAKTVQYHLRKVFAKLGISSRNQLEYVLN